MYWIVGMLYLVKLVLQTNDILKSGNFKPGCLQYTVVLLADS